MDLAVNWYGLSNCTENNSIWWSDDASFVPLLLSDDTYRYLYGPDRRVIAQITGAGAITYLHGDRLGSIRLITDSTGDDVGTSTYSAFGTPSHSGSTTSAFGYAGEYTDTETGFQYLRARYYDPASGQFLTRDPLEEETGDPYGYADGNPVLKTDPTGTLAFLIPAAPVAISGASAAVTLAGGTLGCAITDCVEVPDFSTEEATWGEFTATSFGLEWCADFFGQHGKGNRKETITQWDLDQLAKKKRGEPHDEDAVARVQAQRDKTSHKKATGQKGRRHQKGGSKR